MHKQLKTSASTDDPPNDDDDDEDVPVPETSGADGEMPEDYFFPGWISFKLFGPFAPEQYKSILMMTKDCKFDPGGRDWLAKRKHVVLLAARGVTVWASRRI